MLAKRQTPGLRCCMHAGALLAPPAMLLRQQCGPLPAVTSDCSGRRTWCALSRSRSSRTKSHCCTTCWTCEWLALRSCAAPCSAAAAPHVQGFDEYGRLRGRHAVARHASRTTPQSQPVCAVVPPMPLSYGRQIGKWEAICRDHLPHRQPMVRGKAGLAGLLLAKCFERGSRTSGQPWDTAGARFGHSCLASCRCPMNQATTRPTKQARPAIQPTPTPGAGPAVGAVHGHLQLARGGRHARQEQEAAAGRRSGSGGGGARWRRLCGSAHIGCSGSCGGGWGGRSGEPAGWRRVSRQLSRHASGAVAAGGGTGTHGAFALPGSRGGGPAQQRRLRRGATAAAAAAAARACRRWHSWAAGGGACSPAAGRGGSCGGGSAGRGGGRGAGAPAAGAVGGSDGGSWLLWRRLWVWLG